MVTLLLALIPTGLSPNSELGVAILKAAVQGRRELQVEDPSYSYEGIRSLNITGGHVVENLCLPEGDGS